MNKVCNLYIYIYIYIHKRRSVSFILATLLLSHINDHVIHSFSTFFLVFLIIFFLLISQLIVILSLTFLLLFTFSSLSTTIYLNIAFPLSLYFLAFLIHSSYYKFTILFSILFIVFSHTKGYFSLFLSLSFYFHF